MTDAMRRHVQTLFVIVTTAALSFTVMSCSQDPTEKNALASPVTLPATLSRDTTIYATADSTLKLRKAMNGSLDLVGMGGGYTAIAAIRFPNSSYRDTINVLGATLRLHVVYRLGPSTGTLSFAAYKILLDWDASTATWDTLQASGYYSATPLGTFSGTISADSQYIEFSLDTTTVRKWLQTPDDDDLDRFGIVLYPTSEGVVGGFDSFDADSSDWRPTLTVFAEDVADGTLDTTTYYSGYDTFFGNLDMTQEAGTMVIQAGVPYRGWMKFDVSFLKQGDIVNSATLTMYRQTPREFNTRTVDTAFVAHLCTSGDTSYSYTYTTFTPVSDTSLTFTGDLRHCVQKWITGSNYGVLLRAPSATEYSTFDQFIFYSNEVSAAALRPSLHIVYSTVKLGE